MSNCTCGRTTRYPLCDGSHQLSEEAYKERTERLNQLFNKKPQEHTNTVKESEYVKTTV